MIQRIQTVFLFIAAAAAIALYFFPLAGLYGDQGTYLFYIDRFENMVPGAESVFSDSSVMPLAIINLVVALLAVVAIFMYKKRFFQLRMVRFAIFLDLIMIALIFFYYNNMIEKTLDVVPTYLENIGSYLPIVVFLFLILAHRFIMRDEKLIKSMDRLR